MSDYTIVAHDDTEQTPVIEYVEAESAGDAVKTFARKHRGEDVGLVAVYAGKLEQAWEMDSINWVSDLNDTFDEEDAIVEGAEENIGCHHCSGQCEYMGTLGNLKHYKCRDCGMTNSKETVDAQKAWEKAIQAMEAKVHARVGKDCDVRYSAYKSDANDVPIDNLDEVAFKGSGVIIAEHDPFWGGEASGDYQSKVLTDPTWLDLCVVTQEQMNHTKDGHHCFLEAVRSRGPGRYELSLGS